MSTPIGLPATPDATVIRFEVRHGMRRISCTISDEALEAASGLDQPSTAILRRQSFDRFRTMINAAAMLKLGSLPASFVGSLALSGNDLLGVAMSNGDPRFGRARRAS